VKGRKYSHEASATWKTGRGLLALETKDDVVVGHDPIGIRSLASVVFGVRLDAVDIEKSRIHSLKKETFILRSYDLGLFRIGAFMVKPT
jgi:hypothetical protein